MATSTIVITYTGTPGADAEVQSFTVDGTAYGSLSIAQVYNARQLMKKAQNRVSSDKASQGLSRGQGH